jgi:hypothetical protein
MLSTGARTLDNNSARPADGLEPQPPLGSVHTSSFPAQLIELGISLLVSTYQAGKLVMLRPDGDRLNTHFRGSNKPMGLAVASDRLAIGTGLEIFGVQVLRGVRSPDLINDQPALLADSFVVPDEALAVVPEPLRYPAGSTNGVANRGVVR